MKSARLKKVLLAVSGMVVYQMAGCNLLQQIQDILPNFGNLIPGLGG